MALHKTFKFATQEDLDYLTSIIEEKQIAMFDVDEWQSKTDTAFKIYDADAYLNAAQNYLTQCPPHLVQAGEKLWGCVAFVVQKFFKQMNIAIKSHRGTRALCKFAIRFHPSSDHTVALELFAAYKNGEECHKNFYRPEYTKEELEKFKGDISYFAAEFPKIDYKKVEEALLPYIEGTLTTTKDLENIVFVKCNLQEKLGSEVYQAKYQAK